VGFLAELVGKAKLMMQPGVFLRPRLDSISPGTRLGGGYLLSTDLAITIELVFKHRSVSVAFAQEGYRRSSHDSPLPLNPLPSP
jgi:hypothetical protein